MNKILPALILAAAASLSQSVTVQDVDGAIRWLTKGAPLISTMQRDHMARERTAKAILGASLEFDMDPYQVTSVAFHESWFEAGVKGKAGEIGSMQVKGAVLERCIKDGYDMSTQSGQVRCGTRHLRNEIDRCGNIRDGMAAYIIGACSDKGIKKKVNSRMILTKRLASKPWEE